MSLRFRALVLGVPMLWLGAFLLAPFAIVLAISLASSADGVPPYAPLLERAADGLRLNLSAANYGLLLEDPLYLAAYLQSLVMAGSATAVALVIGYPMAYAIAQAPQAWRNALLLLVMLPFWTSFLLRVYAWLMLLQAEGPVNQLLLWLGLIDQPLQLLATPGAVLLGIIYTYLPFMILPLYAALEKLDPLLLEAAADLGARPWRSFAAVTLPLSVPGMLAGALLVFIPAIGEFVIPELLGGPDTLMIGSVLWSEFFQNRDWPLASAVASAMLVLLVAPIMVFQHLRGAAAAP